MPDEELTIVLWPGRGLYVVLAIRAAAGGIRYDLAGLEGQGDMENAQHWRVRQIDRPLPEHVERARKRAALR